MYNSKDHTIKFSFARRSHKRANLLISCSLIACLLPYTTLAYANSQSNKNPISQTIQHIEEDDYTSAIEKLESLVNQYQANQPKKTPKAIEQPPALSTHKPIPATPLFIPEQQPIVEAAAPAAANVQQKTREKPALPTPAVVQTPLAPQNQPTTTKTEAQIITNNIATDKLVESKQADGYQRVKLSNTEQMTAIALFVNQWKQAWETKDTDNYLKSYQAGYKTAAHKTHNQWKKERIQRISSAQKIQINLEELRIRVIDQHNAQVSFKQTYRSARLNDQTHKLLILVQEQDRWVISAELTNLK